MIDNKGGRIMFLMKTNKMIENTASVSGRCTCPGNNCTCKCEEVKIDVDEKLSRIYNKDV